MHESTRRDRAWHEGLITALAVGGFLIILGVVFGLTPGLPGAIGDFILDLTGINYPAINGAIILPAPAHPADHLAFYGAVFNFMVGITILQIAILAIRLYVHSPIRKISDTIGDLVFWLGGALVANAYLLAGTLTGWFSFWALLIVIIGLSLIARGFVYLISRPKSKPCC